MAMPISISYVDVRDVALAHLLVYENTESSGRYIATNRTLSMSEAIALTKKIRPDLKVSEKVMPAWLARILPAIDFILHKLTGRPRQMKKELIDEYLNRAQLYNSSRLKNELNWSVRSLQDSFKETIDWIPVAEIPLE